MKNIKHNSVAINKMKFFIFLSHSIIIIILYKNIENAFSVKEIKKIKRKITPH